MGDKICTQGSCQSCGVCENICPRSCVTRQKENCNYYMVRGADCIRCGLCSKVCPVSGNVRLYEPICAFAGWNIDESYRKTSASGGAASAIYQYALSQKAMFTGAYLNQDFECHLAIGESRADIEQFQNSKYTYSFPGKIYKQTAAAIQNGKTVFFIGLPCQVAAVRNYFQVLQINSDQLYTIDLVCHGTPDPAFLKQHISSVSRKKGAAPDRCCFRDSRFGTANFVYSLYAPHSEEPYYAKYVNQDDYYQIGYHRAFIYRDACYSCKFAQPHRSGDITIGDFHASDEFCRDTGKENVSALLANTQKGLRLLHTLEQEGRLRLFEKPLDAVIQGEGQLRHPSSAGPERARFLDAYRRKQDYDEACKEAFRIIAVKNTLQLGKIKYHLKRSVQAVIPSLRKGQ